MRANAESCDLVKIIVFFCWSLQAALKQLTTNKVPNMAVLLKSIVHTHADARAVFKDPTGCQSRLHPPTRLKVKKDSAL